MLPLKNKTQEGENKRISLIENEQTQMCTAFSA